MATLKHIASMISDYTAFEAYLVYQLDELTGTVILDAQGMPMLGVSYVRVTVECGEFSLASAWVLANLR